jgi:hypothetical protein
MATTYWVSFATEESFQGVAVIDVDDKGLSNDEILTKVIFETIERGCNGGPDTSVQMQRIPAAAMPIPERFKNRLLTADEVAYLNFEVSARPLN